MTERSVRRTRRTASKRRAWLAGTPAVWLLSWAVGCGSEGSDDPGTSPETPTGGVLGASSGGTSPATGGSPGRGGATSLNGGSTNAGKGGASGGSPALGGGSSAGAPVAPTGGKSASAGSGGTPTGGVGGAGGTSGGKAGKGGAGGSVPLEPLDCGPNGIVIENAGPQRNRVNYAILGDGYTEDQVDTFREHIAVAMAKRFSSPIGEPYGRYRKFVNICAIPLKSESGPIGSGPTPLSCTGSDSTRLADCDEAAVRRAFEDNLPEDFELDWTAVVLNNEEWWNTGSVLMLWSGANQDADGAALHEGGHGFHQLADEYEGTNSGCAREYDEVNSTTDAETTAGKWELWLGYDQSGATGLQKTVLGSRYCEADQYRPSDNSMMNLLFGDDGDTSFNAVSREKMIMDFYRFVTPIDSAEPPAGAVSNPATLTVHVIDPAVIDVDWSVGGEVVMPQGGPVLDVSALALPAGTHSISAEAYDNAGEDLVRYRTGTKWGRMNWARSRQTVSWTVTVP